MASISMRKNVGLSWFQKDVQMIWYLICLLLCPDKLIRTGYSRSRFLTKFESHAFKCLKPYLDLFINPWGDVSYARKYMFFSKRHQNLHINWQLSTWCDKECKKQVQKNAKTSMKSACSWISYQRLLKYQSIFHYSKPVSHENSKCLDFASV